MDLETTQKHQREGFTDLTTLERSTDTADTPERGPVWGKNNADVSTGTQRHPSVREAGNSSPAHTQTQLCSPELHIQPHHWCRLHHLTHTGSATNTTGQTQHSINSITWHPAGQYQGHPTGYLRCGRQWLLDMRTEEDSWNGGQLARFDVMDCLLHAFLIHTHMHTTNSTLP